MIQITKVEVRMNILVDDNKAHKSDFRLTWTAFVAGFLILAGLFIYGYNRLEDRAVEGMKGVTKIDTKLEDLLQRLPPSSGGMPAAPKRP
jgi:hypothetical protein